MFSEHSRPYPDQTVGESSLNRADVPDRIRGKSSTIKTSIKNNPTGIIAHEGHTGWAILLNVILLVYALSTCRIVANVKTMMYTMEKS